MIVSISYSTHSGIVPAILIIIAFTVIGAAAVRRKLNLKRFILAFVLAAAMIVWFALSIGEYITIGEPRFGGLLSYVPFGTIFGVDFKEWGFCSFSEFMQAYLANQLLRAAVSFGFAVIWGALAPTVLNAKKLPRLLRITAAVIIPIEALVMLAWMFKVTDNTCYYDTGSFILLIAGTILGYFIQKGISKLFAKRSGQNDNG